VNIDYVSREPAVKINMVVFLLAYIYTVLLLLFLMMRLLVGIMGTTYAAVQRSALLQWRHLFAARILQLELVYPWKERTFVGKPALGAPGKMVKEVLQVSEFIDPEQTLTVLEAVVGALPASSPLANDLRSLYRAQGTGYRAQGTDDLRGLYNCPEATPTLSLTKPQALWRKLRAHVYRQPSPFTPRREGTSTSPVRHGADCAVDDVLMQEEAFILF